MQGTELKKVVHVITGLNQGGAEMALFRLLAGQSDKSRFHVISLMDEGVFGVRLRGIGIQVTAMRASSAVALPFVLVKLVRVLRQLKPDVVQSWMYHADLVAGLAATILGIPICWGIRHSNLAAHLNKRSTLMVVRLCARLSRYIPAAMVSCSARAAQLHKEFGYVGDFIVIPNGLSIPEQNSDPGHRGQLRSSLGIPHHARVVGHVGRDDPQKDHRTLFAAFDQVATRQPAAILLLIGSGLSVGSPYFEGLASRYPWKDRIVALGPRDDVPTLMAAMDAFLLTSLGEAFPNVVAEAMASGVPCIVTDVGDAAEIVGDTGWVRQAGDVDGLASDLESALNEPTSGRATRQEACRRRILENYALSRMVSAYDQVWGRACSSV